MTKLEKAIKGLELLKQRLILQADVLGYGEHIGDIDNTLELLKAKDINVPTKWIRCKDRPPEVGQRVLILSRYGTVSDAVFNQYDDEHYFDPFGYELIDGYVTHWMPMPEPPKEGD